MAVASLPWHYVEPTGESVGEVRVELELENNHDRELALRGLMGDHQVRRTTVSAVVDTGAAMVVLPEEVVTRLGLRRTHRTHGVYADGRSEELWIAGVVTIGILGREVELNCIVGHTGTTALLGQVALEQMDLLVDCKRHQLIVNPDSPDLPTLRV
jgi:clan AA aspartic protease